MLTTDTYLNTLQHFFDAKTYDPSSIEMLCEVTEALTPRGSDMPLFGEQEDFQRDVFDVLSKKEGDNECLMYYFLLDLMDKPDLMNVAEMIFKRCWIDLDRYSLTYLYEIWLMKSVDGDTCYLGDVMTLMEKHGFKL